MISNSTESLVAASDADQPEFFGGGSGAGDGSPVTGRPAFLSLTGDDAAPGPVAGAAAAVVAATGGTTTTLPDVNNTQAAGGLQGAYYWVRNQVVYGIPGLFTSAKNRLAALFGRSTSGAKVAGSSDTSPVLWVALLLAAVVGVYYATKGKGKGKGGKSFFSKLGGGHSIKL